MLLTVPAHVAGTPCVSLGFLPAVLRVASSPSVQNPWSLQHLWTLLSTALRGHSLCFHVCSQNMVESVLDTSRPWTLLTCLCFPAMSRILHRVFCRSRACPNLSPRLAAGHLRLLLVLSVQFSLILFLCSGYLEPILELVDVPSQDGVGHELS